MLKITKLTRLLCRRFSRSSGGEYVGDIVRALDTEIRPLQVGISLTLFSSRDTNPVLVKEISRYYFDGEGKAIRPEITRMMAGACNVHLKVKMRLEMVSQ